MTKLNKKKINSQIDKILEIGVEWLGLQRTAANILAILYRKSLFWPDGLSVKDLAKETGLSQSTVFSVCANLNSLDILNKRTNGIQQRRGRKSTVYALAVGIDELLRRGLKKNFDQVHKVSKSIDQLLMNIGTSDSSTLALIARTAEEINLFLSEPYSNV